MTDVSFTNPRLAATLSRQRAYSKKHETAAQEQRKQSPLSGEIDDLLAEEIARLDKLARKLTGNPDAARAYNGDAGVKHTVLQWHNSAELVIVIKFGPKRAEQLHFPIVAGWFVYEDGPGVLGWSSSETIEGLMEFLPVLRRDVERILRAPTIGLN